jgi:hypothetical protein
VVCSDLWAIHQSKYKNDKKEASLVARAVMKSLLVGIVRYLYKVYNYHDSRACGYKRSEILFLLDGLDRIRMVLVLSLWNLCAPLCLCDHTL